MPRALDVRKQLVSRQVPGEGGRRREGEGMRKRPGSEFWRDCLGMSVGALVFGHGGG